MDVLIVEDARDQRKLLTAVVRRLGHTVHQAEDGVQALEVLTEHPDISLVVSDWMMPNMDGISLCEAIRDGRFDRYIYFILLTGKTDRDATVKGLSVGADDFLRKPVDYQELEARLKSGARVISLEQRLEQKNEQLSKTLATVESDLESAAKTQESLLAPPAVIQGVGFDWRFQPSQILGGDMFGYHALDDEHVMFYQLDVAGHGIPSALFSFTLNNLLMDVDANTSMLRKQITEPPYYKVRPSEDVVASLNQRFQTTAETMLYFTMIYGVIHSPTGKVRMTHAGHPETLWIRPSDGELHPVKDTGVPVGMMPGMNWNYSELTLKKGDRLFMYSDGITECENPQGEQYGDERLHCALYDGRHLPMKQMVEGVWSELGAWRDCKAFDDDVTCLVLEYQGG
ncbi:PP2C family protein-serine/threonine phosphatase [Sansalvadorimonas verongulae]|uniref:PP2C family protein-serine/threonine phosphatase n=1 Tax=Sansalvadorimonas verongulae TaxID=2172824 RepID=UPI0012BB70C7|nr:fused response regulator/phosphatase [Sansalvadorimonas verongulae]MTI14309.1 fused response regulator/phosphatase [Sansalvadorimonas verongulae]